MSEGAITQTLRQRFRETAEIRLLDMSSLLETLGGPSREPATIDQLARHFHALAGMGGTYGFPKISALGDEGELLMMRARRSGEFDAKTIERWKSLVRQMREDLARE